jgi:hypothetical protein
VTYNPDKQVAAWGENKALIASEYDAKLPKLVG